MEDRLVSRLPGVGGIDPEIVAGYFLNDPQQS
jgi:hypothetical protein